MSINYNLSVNDAANVVDTSPATGGLTNTELRASPVPFSASALPLPAGAATNAELVNLEGIALDASSSNNTRLDSVNAKLASGIPITNFPATQAVSGSFLTDVQLRASAVPVNLASTTVTNVVATTLASTTVTNTVAVSGAFYQATQPISIASPVAVTGPLTDAQLRAASVPVTVSGSVTTGGLTDAQLRASAVPVSLASTTITNTVGVSGTFFQATQPISGSVSVSNFPATQAISAAALPLPADAATETSLASVNAKTPALGQALAIASVPVVLTSIQLNTLTPLTSIAVNNFPATQSVSGTVIANAGTNLNTSLLALDSTVAKDSSLTTLNTSVNSLLKPSSTLANVTSVGAIASTVTIKADILANQTSALKTSDGLGSTGANGSLNLALANTAYEAKVAATSLASRKSVLIQAVDADMYWGYASSVTASSGALLLKGQTIEFACDPGSAFQVWLVTALANKNARIAEST